ncbi:M23 family metallopeptidase [Qipengyuania sp. MTN3-11]|uniref:M23 family metallopeptidase n=1 Tax=Qipengyuania sp. MTN3-11 TaxID=3056557 RepID=UPI0036F3047C
MFKTFLKAKLFALAGGLAIAAAPAQADDAELTPSVKHVQPGVSVTREGTDRQFQELFASWEKTERVLPLAAAVSVPSRMPLENARMSSNFGLRTHPVLGGLRGHKGVDLAAPTGTPVYATADGYVSKAEWFSSYGKYIAIEHGADMQTRFAHLSGIEVSEGDKVRKGDLIGYVGSTGRSTGPHLHYEVRVAGLAVDPTPYMNGERLAMIENGGQGGGDE